MQNSMLFLSILKRKDDIKTEIYKQNTLKFANNIEKWYDEIH